MDRSERLRDHIFVGRGELILGRFAVVDAHDDALRFVGQMAGDYVVRGGVIDDEAATVGADDKREDTCASAREEDAAGVEVRAAWVGSDAVWLGGGGQPGRGADVEGGVYDGAEAGVLPVFETPHGVCDLGIHERRYGF